MYVNTKLKITKQIFSTWICKSMNGVQKSLIGGCESVPHCEYKVHIKTMEGLILAGRPWGAVWGSTPSPFFLLCFPAVSSSVVSITNPLGGSIQMPLPLPYKNSAPSDTPLRQIAQCGYCIGLIRDIIFLFIWANVYNQFLLKLETCNHVCFTFTRN